MRHICLFCGLHQVDKSEYFLYDSSEGSSIKRGVMETKNQTINEQSKGSRLLVVAVPMEGRSPEEIARDAVIHINELFDTLIEEMKNNPNNKK